MTAKNKKVLFVINKYSGKGFQRQMEGRIVDVCNNYDVESTLAFTSGPGHATQLAREAVEGKFEMVVAVGGDGTVNEVARGLIHTNVPMGIIPKGSGNGLARHLGIPLTLPKATQSLFKSKALLMDVFTVNKRLSLNVSGIGFDGHIANQFGKNGKRGLIGYAKLALEEYLQFNAFDVTIKLQGNTLRRNTFVVAVANSSQYGNNARIAPKASVTDQKLNITLISKIPPYRMDLIYAFFKGKIDETSFCETFETDTIELVLDKPIEYHVDGEPCGEDVNFKIAMLPASLSVLVPVDNDNL